jgi:vacuolar-type H+-ATPase subunit E/Vma4
MGHTRADDQLGSATPRGEDEVLRSIVDEARREAEAVLAAADARAMAIVEEARGLVAARLASALEAAEAEAHADAARLVNRARLRLVHRRAELAARRLDEAFDEARRRLEAIAAGGDPPRWARALAALASDGCERVGGAVVIEVRPCDLALLDPPPPGVAQVLGTLPVAGVRVRSVDGRDEIDATLDGRLARARLTLADQVATALEPGTAGSPGA